MNVLTDSHKEVSLPPPVKLSASAARRRRRRRRPRSNSALLAALPLDQREMFRNLWRATLQAFVGSQNIIGEGESASPQVSMRDDTQARSRDVVKVRNVLLEAESEADYLARERKNVVDSERLSSSLKQDDLEYTKKRDKKCKKRSRRSRSCSTESSSSDSNSGFSDHSTDRGARKKSHRHKKKREKRKAKKRSRDSKDDSVEADRKRPKRDKHKKKKDNSSRKSRRDLPRNFEKNIQKSKLSFSPYAGDEEDTKMQLIEENPGTQLCLKLPRKKLNGPVWVAGSSEEEKSCSSRDSLSLNKKDRNGNSMVLVKQTSPHQQQNGLRDAPSKDCSPELQAARGVSNRRKSGEQTQRKSSTNDSKSPVTTRDAPTLRKSSYSPDCVKIRKLLANRRTPPQDSVAADGKACAPTNGTRNHSEESLPRETSSKHDTSKWERADDLPVAYRSRSVSPSGSSSRSRSRSMSRRSRSTSRRSDSRRRSSSRSTYTSRSRSKSFSSRSSRSRSYSRSHSRHRSLSIPRRSGSPSFLDKRRITSARKRPVPYNRYRHRSSSPESSDDDAKS